MNLIRTTRWAALALAAALVGCDSTPSPAPSPSPSPSPSAEPRPKPADAKPEANKAADAAKPAEAPKKLDIAAAKLSEKELASIEKLDEADRKIALEQKLCPIQGGHLGGMGKPYKVSLNGHTVFLCCEGCEEDAKAKPAEALAKLGR
jgi:Cu(I)/Ag(I) efflux system membrane fusion protein